MLIQRFDDLEAWQVGHGFVLAVYQATKQFPREEVFGVTSQLRRCAVSIPSNLAEGFGRHSKREFLRYTLIADGSLQEAKYYLMLARDLKYCPTEAYESLSGLADRVGALLGGLEKHLKSRVHAG